MSPLGVAALGAILLIGSACSSGPTRAPPETAPGSASAGPDLGPPRVGDVAPAVGLPDRNGKTVELAALRGSIVVLHFTAAWCPYCDAEIESIERMARSYAGSGVKVLLVDIQDKDDAWRSLESRVKEPVILLRDATGDASRRFAPEKAQPSFENRAEVMLAATVVVDEGGKIAALELIDTNPARGFDPELTPIRRNLDDHLSESDSPHVLDVTADAAEGAPGSRGEIMVHVHVGPAFHVMSDDPSKPSYVPTRVALSGPPGVRIESPRYPAPASYRLAGQEIRTFRGNVDVSVPFSIEDAAPEGSHAIHGSLHYQACTSTRCLFPRDEAFATTLRIVPSP